MDYKNIQHWFYGLVSGFIGGGASTAGAWFGMIGAKQMGMDVPELHFTALVIMFLSGGITSALAYLKQSPLPPENTIQITQKTTTTITDNTNQNT